MIIKIINSGIIILLSTIIGFKLAKRYTVRIQELSAMQGALSRLETEIQHYTSSLPEALLEIGKSVGGGTGNLFILTGQTLIEKKEYTVSEAWSLCLEKVKPELCFEQEDFYILRRFGSQLGKSDKEGQVRFIRLTMLQLQEEEKKARVIREKNDKMYRSLGLLGGLALTILLL